MPELRYVEGDATQPEYRVLDNYLVHVCNDVGAWGAGFVLALNRKWTEPKKVYLDFFAGDLGDRKAKDPTFPLGVMLPVSVDSGKPIVGLTVVNMIAQRGIGRGVRRIDYGQLAVCLLRLRVAIEATHNNSRTSSAVEIHMPRIGAGLAGGDWEVIEELIKALLVPFFNVTVYDLPKKRRR